MKAHSAAVCQCSSRTPPLVRRISTPARVFETASSRWVTSRDQPPSCRRLWAKAKGYLKVCTPPASVDGGLKESGFWASRTELTGPGSLLLLSVMDLEFSFSWAASFSAERMLAAARVAEPTPRKPRRFNCFLSDSPFIASTSHDGNRLSLRF